MKRVLMAAVLLPSFAFASIPDSSGTYTGCFQKEIGKLRVIDPTLESCTNTELRITWNSQGQAGESVVAIPLSPGDLLCPFGGTKFIVQGIETQACNGAPGLPGVQGHAGPAGADGANGSSVISATIAPGNATCPYGGTQFTSVSGITYACNGSPGSSGTGEVIVTNTPRVKTADTDIDRLETFFITGSQLRDTPGDTCRPYWNPELRPWCFPVVEGPFVVTSLRVAGQPTTLMGGTPNSVSRWYWADMGTFNGLLLSVRAGEKIYVYDPCTGANIVTEPSCSSAFSNIVVSGFRPY